MTKCRAALCLFISAKAMATMEFLQKEWVNDGNFIGAGSERDPIVGLQEKEATFTIPREPVRRRIHGIETFNVLRGGEYFFMPSLTALNGSAIWDDASSKHGECSRATRSQRQDLHGRCAGRHASSPCS